MALKHPAVPARTHRDLQVDPMLTADGSSIPRHSLARTGLSPEVAYQVVHDELMVDGNARMNLATFVTTWMEPQAERLMAETLDKNMIDKDEYPQTAELERRCVEIISRLWHAPDVAEATGCSTTGSSEAAMLGGLALKRRWQQRRRADGKPADRPNMVTGTNVQVCWEKFASYWDVELRQVPMEGERFHMSAAGCGRAVRREHHRRGRGARVDVRRVVRAGRGHLRGAGRPAGAHRAGRPRARGRRVRRVRRAVHRPGPGVGLRPAAGGVDQHLGAQVRPGVPGRRLGGVAGRRRRCRPT